MAKIPDLLWETVLTKVPQREYKNHVVSYINNMATRIRQGVSIWLYGPYGSGKSSIAAILLKAAFAHGYVGYWVRANDITGHLIMKDRYDARSTVYEHLQEVPLLVIDEFVMRERMAQLEASVEDLIRHRMGAVRPTIVTTNHTLTDLQDNYPALANVVQTFLCLQVSGKDFRHV